MSNEKRTLIYMMSKELYTDPINKILEITEKIAQKFKIDPNELMLMFCMDLLKTSVAVAAESGYSVDLHHYADAVKEYLDDRESNPEVN